jgi:hypothetical protein
MWFERIGLLPLFQAKIGDDYFTARCQATNFCGDVGLFAGRGFGQPSLEDLELLFPVPSLPQFSMPLNDSTHAALHVNWLVIFLESAS